MKTRSLKRHPIARADEVGTFHIMDSGSGLPECGHGLAQGEKKKFNRANRETVTCGRCKRTLLYKHHTDEFKRLDWIANREKPYCYTVTTRLGEEITGTVRATGKTNAAYDVWKIHGDAEKIDVLPAN